ncbi:adenylate kinase [Mobiluncus mulieris]|uniref:Adenylate kinase n=1 Tax=Mobiluncus mulieris TaxID=2052 RepID=A0A7Y0USC9_9ACTO|nr:adenylate kinase [Mobiluncus mulieris]NMX02528.1 adenylate kinase [Mobiluncus mulieris]
MKLIIMGPPGAGKGTHATNISQRLGVAWISTGDIFRHHKAAQTDFGKLIASYIDKGEFVPDEVTDRIVCDRLEQADARQGFLLDGYPRNLSQAEVLRKFLTDKSTCLDAALYLEVPPEEVKQRLLHRAVVQGRADDTEEVITHRLEVFFNSTKPLLDFYAQEGSLRQIDGVGEIPEIAARISAVLDEIESKR